MKDHQVAVLWMQPSQFSPATREGLNVACTTACNTHTRTPIMHDTIHVRKQEHTRGSVFKENCTLKFMHDKQEYMPHGRERCTRKII